ncbi:hypothetical protein [Cryobacterium sp. Y57]|uniref:hypothetical protein n=1 Tax=Cryobacterium sp. Y57 TaxID=2048287 RepID=UPI000CE479EE|nr:hypothetical protein [Cryobacterium sp. Y57]
MTNNRFTDNLNSDTNRLAKLRATMMADSAVPDPTDFGGMSASAVPSGGRADYVFTSQQVVLAHSRVLQTGILDKLVAWRSEDARVAGASARSTFISDRAILVGLLLLASEHGPLLISSLAMVFQNRLTPESRALLHLADVAPASLGDTREDKRWYGGTHRAFHRLLVLMDPFPHNQGSTITSTEAQAVLDAHEADHEKKMRTRLDEFTNAFLHMTFLQQPRHLRYATGRIDLAVGQTFIASPTTRGFSRKTRAETVTNEIGADPRTLPHGPIDVFAGAGTAYNGRNNPRWGWMVNSAVRVDSERPEESRFPQLAISATLSLPNIGAAEEAVSLMRTALSTGLAPGILDIDKAYFASSPVAGLHESRFNLGFTPSTDYRVERLDEHDLPASPDGIRAQQSVTLDKNDGMRQRQPITYGSEQRQAFHNHARNSMECLNAGITESLFESLSGTSRQTVRGFAAAQIFLTISLSNYNLSAIAAFLRKQISKPVIPSPAAELPANICRRDREWHAPYVSPNPADTSPTPEDGAVPTT